MSPPIDFDACHIDLQARIVRGTSYLPRLRLPPAALQRPQPKPLVYRPGQAPKRQAIKPRLDAPDITIQRIADHNAALCQGAQVEASNEHAALTASVAIVESVGLAPPLAKPGAPIGPLLARMRCSRWWRRRLRVEVGRRTEMAHLDSGKVHRGAQCYASDSAVDRRHRAGLRNGELMKAMLAVNEHGECFSLEQLAEHSLSNPEMRRSELMTRAKGFETLAAEGRLVGLFVTWTLPSRFHATGAIAGKRNPKYDGSSPRVGSNELNRQWGLVRSHLKRLNVPCFGIRVAEPHHDATPHWHLLVFVERSQRKAFVDTVRSYALSESPGEPGARKHRVKFKTIHESKGSAVGYISKYIAKNIDGFKLDEALEHGADGKRRPVGNAVSAAERIRAWASTWRIRQFQLFGSPPVTWWRELRRADAASNDVTLEAARSAADKGDYAGFVKACGGVCALRAALTLKTHRQESLNASGSPTLTLYGEVRGLIVKGVELAENAAVRIITRIHTWTLLEPREVRLRTLDLCQ